MSEENKDPFGRALSYTAVPSPVQPEKSQKPGVWDLNPIGSNYAKETNKSETNLIK